MKLAQLVEELGGECALPMDGGPALGGVRLDSRFVRAGDLFAALPGRAADGARFVGDALRRGAAAVLSPARLSPAPSVPNWVHPKARRVAGEAAALLLGRPSGRLQVVAITGTNGKTTTAHLAGQLLARAGRVPAVLGTAGNRLAGGLYLSAELTTPDGPELQRLCARHLALGGDSMVLELSSHALEQDRHAGLEVDIAVFTNLTRDHLDYHGDLERYAAAKERLFHALRPGSTAVLNADDPISARMAGAARSRGARVVTFGTRSRADLRASDIVPDSGGIRCSIHGMGISRTLRLSLAGRFNVGNALAALSVVLLFGASPSDASEGLASLSPAPGRLEPVPGGARAFRVLVDYAHTEDALVSVLSALREELAAAGEGGRLLCVFGCGGDRDPGKRAPMGAAADRLADVCVVTSDNPRGENPGAIVAAILAGMGPGHAEVHVEPDRRAAIALALERARPGDLVLIAGKGHETTQTIGGRALPFDDRRVAAELLAARAPAAAEAAR